MRNLSYPRYGSHTVAFLPPVWTRLPAADRVGVAAAVLAVAFVALVVGVRVRQAFDRPSKRRTESQDVVRMDTSWFTAHSLDGFPAEAVRTTLKGPDAPSLDRLYAAWVLAQRTRGMSAAWLERNLALPSDAAHLIVDATEARRAGRRESHDENTTAPQVERDPTFHPPELLLGRHEQDARAPRAEPPAVGRVDP